MLGGGLDPFQLSKSMVVCLDKELLQSGVNIYLEQNDPPEHCCAFGHYCSFGLIYKRKYFYAILIGV